MSFPTMEDIAPFGQWFQQVTFPNGLTVGGHQAARLFGELSSRVDITGKTVLDIGCNAGVMCMEAENAGAFEVTGIDVEERFMGQCDIVKRAFHLKTFCYGMDSVYALKDALYPEFDIVLFCGVYYHLKHPLLGLERAWACTRQHLLVEGAVFPGEDPTMTFSLGAYDNDDTNWWYPTVRCMEDMIRSLGPDAHFERIPFDYDGSGRAMWLVTRQ